MILLSPRSKGKSKAKSKASTRSIQAFKLEHKQLAKAITFYLAKDMRPVYTVELPGFRVND